LNVLWAMGLMVTSWETKGFIFVPVVFAVLFMMPAVMMPKRSGARLTPLLGITAVMMFVYALLFMIL
ncbi:MAG: hypothetical protein K2H84_01575, partial [Paramuribaculum sp.]|nr:hypothetical protein [Paramuribaculum sp.]